MDVRLGEAALTLGRSKEKGWENLPRCGLACSQGFVPAVCWWVCVFAIDVIAHVRERIEAGACIGMHSKRDSGDVTGWHLVRLGKQKMGSSADAMAGGGGLYYFLVGNGELRKDRALWRGMAQAGVNNTEATSAPKEKHANFLKAKLQELHPLRFSKWPWTDPFLAPGSQE